MNVKYETNGVEVTPAQFRDATDHLDYQTAQHCYRERGELYTFPDHSSVELVNDTETNQHGFKRDVRIWIFTSKEK